MPDLREQLRTYVDDLVDQVDVQVPVHKAPRGRHTRTRVKQIALAVGTAAVVSAIAVAVLVIRSDQASSPGPASRPASTPVSSTTTTIAPEVFNTRYQECLHERSPDEPFQVHDHATGRAVTFTIGQYCEQRSRFEVPDPGSDRVAVYEVVNGEVTVEYCVVTDQTKCSRSLR